MDAKQYNEENCPVTDLLNLIEQQNIDHLRDSLLDSIEKLGPGCDIYLFEHTTEVFDKQSKFRPELVNHRGIKISKDELNKNINIKCDSDSILFDGFNYLEDGTYVQVFTIESENSSRGLLITAHSKVLNEDYINTLISAYNNQILLLKNRDTDALTGLYNRQFFDHKLLKIHQSLGRSDRKKDKPIAYCFALLDIDFFKKVNDKYGHVYGDEVLLIFASLMKKSFRDIDILFRYGGEEFAVLLSDIDAETGHKVLDRFRNSVEEFDFPLQNKVTASIGYCQFNENLALPSLIENADKALYYSKQNGRNQVNNYEILVSQGHLEDRIIDDGDIELF